MQRARLPGTRHPLTLLQNQMLEFFHHLGYSTADGPEVEAEWFNFDVLNMSQSHFARAPDHTFYIEHPHSPGERSGLVMRAHTSPVQARAMLNKAPPLYKVCIGRTFRPDPLDATHSPVFNQLEGLAVSKGLTMADLQNTLDQFASAIFAGNIVTRMRPYEFAYAEPAAEIDVQCMVCKGKLVTCATCATCSGEGWIEWGGCGMVHPKVLQNCGIDPAIFSAFSFGIGVERTLMLRSGIEDIRQIVDSNIQYALTARDSLPALETSAPVSPETTLAAAGFIEITSFPFTETEGDERMNLPPGDRRRQHLSLLNPIAGQGAALRTTLLPGLMEALARTQISCDSAGSVPNIKDIALFEHGRVFYSHEMKEKIPSPPAGNRPAENSLEAINKAIPPQPRHLAAICFCQTDWKHIVEIASTVLHSTGQVCHTQSAHQVPWALECCVEIRNENSVLGYAGQLEPNVLAAFGLPAGLCAFELII